MLSMLRLDLNPRLDIEDFEDPVTLGVILETDNVSTAIVPILV
jgi:hypothetical protein